MQLTYCILQRNLKHKKEYQIVTRNNSQTTITDTNTTHTTQYHTNAKSSKPWCILGHVCALMNKVKKNLVFFVFRT